MTNGAQEGRSSHELSQACPQRLVGAQTVQSLGGVDGIPEGVPVGVFAGEGVPLVAEIAGLYLPRAAASPARDLES
ncbi:hypothetical protein GW17_00017494 [Ensete ventricosum]|uniref:Uncharacterized protein n=1 Tax=Ensete ventricosum TaxID=4639 RepID=A0A426Z9W9_ENSVE|nr:hypothetical protein B296_00044743 [Ensete ventricosum]RWW18520.1 hypothetical protein GW17_00017494 [Ensete ventricosum]RZS29009.1 hypothetical protein BHM03_00062673 [Ensete ventricosum]